MNHTGESGSLSREKLLWELIDNYRRSYELLIGDWKDLDHKAQGTVAMAGIFLAAIFAFIRQFPANISSLEAGLLLAVTLLLFCGVAIAVFALRVRALKASVYGEQQDKLVSDLLILDAAEISGHLNGFLNDQLHLWRAANTALTEGNLKKARLLLGAQIILIAAILVIALLTILQILVME